jgi:hypothetical protein
MVIVKKGSIGCKYTSMNRIEKHLLYKLMVGMASKCTKDAENVSAPLVMVSIVARKRTPAAKTV